MSFDFSLVDTAIEEASNSFFCYWIIVIYNILWLISRNLIHWLLWITMSKIAHADFVVWFLITWVVMLVIMNHLVVLVEPGIIVPLRSATILCITDSLIFHLNWVVFIDTRDIISNVTKICCWIHQTFVCILMILAELAEQILILSFDNEVLF